MIVATIIFRAQHSALMSRRACDAMAAHCLYELSRTTNEFDREHLAGEFGAWTRIANEKA